MTKAKTALITGVTGQDGAYLARLLLDDPGPYQPTDFIRASSHAVLREQAEHMDVSDQCPSLQKAFAPLGSSTHRPATVASCHSYAGAGAIHAITSKSAGQDIEID